MAALVRSAMIAERFGDGVDVGVVVFRQAMAGFERIEGREADLIVFDEGADVFHNVPIDDDFSALDFAEDEPVGALVCRRIAIATPKSFFASMS